MNHVFVGTYNIIIMCHHVHYHLYSTSHYLSMISLQYLKYYKLWKIYPLFNFVVKNQWQKNAFTVAELSKFDIFFTRA